MRTCVNCGKPLNKNNPNQKVFFCSKECRKEGRRLVRKTIKRNKKNGNL